MFVVHLALLGHHGEERLRIRLLVAGQQGLGIFPSPCRGDVGDRDQGGGVHVSDDRVALLEAMKQAPWPPVSIAPRFLRYCNPYTTTRLEKVGRYTCPLAIVGAANFA